MHRDKDDLVCCIMYHVYQYITYIDLTWHTVSCIMCIIETMLTWHTVSCVSHRLC